MDTVTVVLSDDSDVWFVDSYSRRGNALYESCKRFDDRNTAMAHALKWCALVVDMLDVKRVVFAIRNSNGDDEEIVLKDE